MRTSGTIRVECLDVDKFPINPLTLALVDHLRGGGTVPPIKVVPRNGGRYFVLDGRHRVLAFKLLGQKSIQAGWGVLSNPMKR